MSTRRRKPDSQPRIRARKEHACLVQMALNTGSLFQFYTGYKEQSPVILLEYTLRETIDPEKLQAALEKIKAAL